jgi:hypothetical protein
MRGSGPGRENREKSTLLRNNVKGNEGHEIRRDGENGPTNVSDARSSL